MCSCPSYIVTIDPPKDTEKYIASDKAVWSSIKYLKAFSFPLVFLLQIVSLLPQSWSHDPALSVKSVQGLKRFLVQFAETCYRTSLGYSGQNARDTRWERKREPTPRTATRWSNEMKWYSFKLATTDCLLPPFCLRRSNLTRILKMLVRINANKEAITMATEYKLTINSQWWASNLLKPTKKYLVSFLL